MITASPLECQTFKFPLLPHGETNSAGGRIAGEKTDPILSLMVARRVDRVGRDSTSGVRRNGASSNDGRELDWRKRVMEYPRFCRFHMSRRLT